jgi:hypothetical protein
METAPDATPVASPVDPTVATAALLDAHVTAFARGNTRPSLNFPIA